MNISDCIVKATDKSWISKKFTTAIIHIYSIWLSMATYRMLYYLYQKHILVAQIGQRLRILS